MVLSSFFALQKKYPNFLSSECVASPISLLISSTKDHQSYLIPLTQTTHPNLALLIGTYFQSQRRLNAESIGKRLWSDVFIVAQIYRLLGRIIFVPFLTPDTTSSRYKSLIAFAFGIERLLNSSFSS